jgi:hypothetical protein
LNVGVFTSAYLAPIAYYKALLKFDTIRIEQHDSWLKQTFRNRCYIDSPNGKLMLNFPIQHTNKPTTKEVLLSDNENWQARHWQAIKTSYGSSPFFEILAPELEPFYQTRYSSLLQWNLDLLKLTFNWLQVDIKIELTEDWEANYKDDYRNQFSPKVDVKTQLEAYPQVFDTKHEFLDNLSIVDLLFNEGPAAYSYLTQ